MEFPVKNKQIGTRITDEELEFLNELIGKLFPDQDWSDPTLTMRTVFMKIAETADMKLGKVGQSKPEDLTKIKQLKDDLDALDEKYQNSLISISNLETEFQGLETLNLQLSTRNEELETELSGISNEKNEVSEKVRTLEKYVPVPNEMRIVVDPLTLEVLNLYAEKIRIRQKVDITGGKILLTLFNRYITKQETQLPGFPFLVSRQEIAQLAKKIENDTI